MTSVIKVKNGSTFEGEISVSGAKNAVLPVMCSTILSNKKVQITNVPDVSDVNNLLDILSTLGSRSNMVDNSIQIDNTVINNTVATYEMVQKMRASVLILGPMLGRFGRCSISLPGGCAIGARPVDLHLKAMEALGAKITIHDGYVEAVADKGLIGADIIFEKVTVGGTENAVMAAVTATGITTITNAAREPEIIQLCEFLVSGGADIKGIGTSNLRIKGTSGALLSLDAVEIIPDRIEAGTFLCAAAIVGRPVRLKKVNPSHLISVIAKLQEMGCDINIKSNEINIKRVQELKPTDIHTMEYPGFPTDMQAQFLAVLTQARGTSTIKENLFENRFMNVPELRRMGAKIQVYGNTATVVGPVKLNGTNVKSTDLRGGASLIIAGLVSNGVTTIHDIYHILRGYENAMEKLQRVGVDCLIENIDEK